MVACQIAHSMFHTPTRLARVRAPDYLVHPELFAPDAVPVDVLISPEKLVTTFVQHLIEQPGALQILDFLDNRVQLVALCAENGGPLVGKQLRNLGYRLPKVELRVVAIFRRDRAIVPDGETVIEADDEIFFLASRRDIHAVVAAFRPIDKPYHRIIIAGGGNIGKRLAELLESRYRVKIVERNEQRCRNLAASLRRTIVLHGDASDVSLARSENFDQADVYCAVSNDDEVNILSAMLAKRMGVRKTLAIINRSRYVDLVQGSALDIALSPAQITIGAILTHIRRGDFVAVHSLRRGAAEAIEIVAHGDHQTSRVVGRCIDELPLPEGTTVGAIARQERVIFPQRDTVVESGDHIVVFLADKAKIIEVEKLFQVAVTYI
jgi:trk system potassium uptake protein TrkA